ncbi:MAG: L,D-transpeptidase family protein [Bacteroidetes bacterium]|nr:L,D-transpeptidase family protein [Bacteroidota bacterium]
MKRFIKHIQRSKTVCFLLTILGIFAVLQSTASCNTERVRSIAKVAQRDTSVAAFIQQYMVADNAKDRGLYFPISVKRFYEANNGEAAWVKEGSSPKQTWEAMLLLDCVLQYGLSHNDYHPKELLYKPLHEMLEEPGKIGNKEKAKFDILLSDAMITLMNNLHYGKLNPIYYPGKIDSDLMLPFHAEDALANARRQSDFMNAVLSVQPKSRQYAAMQDRMRLLKGMYQDDCYQIPESEVRKIAINMERLRWAEINEDAYIQVNIPSYNLKFIQPDTTYEFKVVVGKPTAQTPSLSSEITYFTTYPEWKIPQSIFVKELLPKALKNAAYLDNSHFTIYDKAGNYVNPTKANLQNVKRHPQSYYARQSSGCDNALGNLVFRFQNIYDIYLHDTPEQQLFKKEERAFSHSCIRVENALHLAELVLKFSGDANKIAVLHNAYKAQLTRNISLKKHVPIKITYLTCEVKEGVVITYNDIYNLDKSLEMALYNTTQTLTTIK